jgi:hypothetical protein
MATFEVQAASQKKTRPQECPCFLCKVGYQRRQSFKCCRVAGDRKEGTGIVKRSFFSIGLLVFTALVVLTVTGPARADLVITGGTATVSAGGTGSVDFTISSTTGADTLSSFNVQLQIGVLTGGSFLQFTSTQPDPYARSNYVFFGNSAGANSTSGFPFWVGPTTTVTPNDTISGGDFTNDGGFVTITQSPGTLLMDVQFQAAAGAAVGNSFSIGLVPSSGTGNGQTFFNDQNGAALNYTSTAATVTLTAPASTTEPSSFALTGLASLGFMFYRRRSKRKNLEMTKSESAVATLN